MINTDEIYTSNNCGQFKVVNYIDCMNVEVEFISTGYKVTVEASHVRRGQIKDRLLPSVYGVGFLGDGKYKVSVNRILTKSYIAWRGMIGRCYYPKLQETNPTYIGCTVDESWHNFQNFAKWFDENYIDGYQLDKDIKIKGNKVYSPETCSFVSFIDNNLEAHAKHYKLYSPDGEIVDVHNLRGFCRDNNLDQRAMSDVTLGNRPHHKGWKIQSLCAQKNNHC
jgi:hypothetical protein